VCCTCRCSGSPGSSFLKHSSPEHCRTSHASTSSPSTQYLSAFRSVVFYTPSHTTTICSHSACICWSFVNNALVYAGLFPPSQACYTEVIVTAVLHIAELLDSGIPLLKKLRKSVLTGFSSAPIHFQIFYQYQALLYTVNLEQSIV